MFQWPSNGLVEVPALYKAIGKGYIHNVRKYTPKIWFDMVQQFTAPRFEGPENPLIVGKIDPIICGYKSYIENHMS